MCGSKEIYIIQVRSVCWIVIYIYIYVLLKYHKDLAKQ